MRLASYIAGGRASYGAVVDGGVDGRGGADGEEGENDRESAQRDLNSVRSVADANAV